METLEALGKRIETTTNLQSIVRTMKSLSVVSIRQYEQAVVSLRDYAAALERGLQVVLADRPHAPERTAPAGPLACILFGSDHGMCGRFNAEIVRSALDGPGRRDALWAVVGLRAQARLEAEGVAPARGLMLPGAVDGLAATARDVLTTIDDWRRERGVARVLLFHNRRTEDSMAAPRRVQLLPLDPEWLRGLAARDWPSRRLPTFTMDAAALFSSLVRQHLFVEIFRAGAESLASEHATRLAAMQAAERNIQENLEEMNAAYRTLRQQSITEELLDVVAGFETLRTAEGEEGDTA